MDAVLKECAYFVVLTGVTFLISAFSYEFFEKKILRFKRHFEAKYPPASCHPTADVRAIAKAVGS